MGKLDGKVALVTGASKGIGAGVALSLAKEGGGAVELSKFRLDSFDHLVPYLSRG